MKTFFGQRWPLLFTLGILMLLCVGNDLPEPVVYNPPPELKPVLEGNSIAAFDLFSRLKSEAANFVISPFSVSSAMAMAYGGARGDTEKQMAQALHFPTDQRLLHSGMGALLNSFTNFKNGDVELNVGNALWPERDYQFTTDFLDLCRTHYRADVEFGDFRASAGRARQDINSWAERETKGMVKSLLAPGSLNTDTRLVIANAIYFKGKWASRFNKRKTAPGPFWVNPENVVRVPMMSQKSTFLYLADGDTQILEMPYRGENFSMLVLLPKTNSAIADLKARLNLANLTNWIEQLRPAEVDLLFPRFKISSQFALRPTLSQMGMSDAFDGSRADFTGMTTQRPLSIDQVEHAASIEVDEEGTVAASATGFSFGCAQRPPPVTFRADHPFIFLILDRSTRTLLFMGRVSNPNA